VAELRVDPGAIEADGSTILRAADELTGLRGDLRGTSFGGETVARGASFGGETVAAAEAGYEALADRWRAGATELADAVESLGRAVRGAAEVYRLTEDANVRRP
jgi:uncharacterized protein YukE